MKWAHIDENRRVHSIEVADARPAGGLPCADETVVGDLFDGWGFRRPKWTAYQFLLRFTPQERAAFRAGAASDPPLADFLQLAQAAQEVDAGDPITLAGMSYLVSVGVLSEQRRKEVLDEP
jgi:hypothetical protein